MNEEHPLHPGTPLLHLCEPKQDCPVRSGESCRKCGKRCEHVLCVERRKAK